MMDLFRWEEQEAKYNLSWSGVEPVEDLSGLEYDDRDLVEILAEWYGVEPSNILIVHGAQEALFLVYLALRPREIHVQRPTYPAIVEQAEALGIRVVFHGVKPVDVSGGVISIANPNNPLGIYIDPGIYVDENIVIGDEIFKYFVRGDNYIHENYIIVSGSSKFFPVKGRKVGWIVAREDYIDRIRRYRDLVSPPPIYEEELIKYIFSSYRYFRERNLGIVKGNLDALRRGNRFFRVRYGEYMPVAVLESDTDSMDLALKLYNECSVLLTPMEYFYHGNGLRISLGYRDVGILTRALDEINRFMESIG